MNVNIDNLPVGRALDGLVADKILHLKFDGETNDLWLTDVVDETPAKVPNYSASDGHAWGLLKQQKPVYILEHNEGQYCLHIIRTSGNIMSIGYSLGEVVCKALLKAAMANEVTEVQGEVPPENPNNN